MDAKLTILPLTVAYIEDIIPLVYAMHKETGDMVLGENDKEALRAFYLNHLSSGGMGLMALDGDRVIGFISFNILPRPYHELPYGFTLHFYVEPDYRATRIGGELARSAQKIVEKAGIRTLEFLVTPKAKLIEKWKRRGWSVRYVVMRKEL